MPRIKKRVPSRSDPISFGQLDERIGAAHYIGYEAGYKAGHDAGYKAGLKVGKRLAKGKSKFAKPHGRPKVLGDIWALQFVDFVDEQVAGGKSPGAAVEMYRDAMTRGLRAEGIDQFSCSVFEQDRLKARGVLMEIYRRIKNGKSNIDPRMRDAYAQLKRFKPDT